MTASVRYLRAPMAHHTVAMAEIPRHKWPEVPDVTPPARVWMSKDYLAMLFVDGERHRLSIQSTWYGQDGRAKDGMTWDELQMVKEQTVGDVWAVEVYPTASAVVDVANMRHLWILDAGPPFGWNTKPRP